MPKSGVPAMYKLAGRADPRFANAEVTDRQKWRAQTHRRPLEKNPAAPTSPSGPPPAPHSPPLTAIARKFLCPQDLEFNMPRTNKSTGAGKAPLTLQPLGDGTVSVTVSSGGQPGGPGYWSYSVNSVLNSLGRLRDNPVFLADSSNPNSNVNLPGPTPSCTPTSNPLKTSSSSLRRGPGLPLQRRSASNHPPSATPPTTPNDSPTATTAAET